MLPFFMTHKITGTFSLAFVKGKIGKVQNYIGTKRKILLKITVASVPCKWTHLYSSLIFTNYFNSWENSRASREGVHNSGKYTEGESTHKSVH